MVLSSLGRLRARDQHEWMRYQRLCQAGTAFDYEMLPPKRLLEIRVVDVGTVYFDLGLRCYCIELELRASRSLYLEEQVELEGMAFAEPELEVQDVKPWKRCRKGPALVSVTSGSTLLATQVINPYFQGKSLPSGKPIKGFLLLTAASPLDENTLTGDKGRPFPATLVIRYSQGGQTRLPLQLSAVRRRDPLPALQAAMTPSGAGLWEESSEPAFAQHPPNRVGRRKRDAGSPGLLEEGRKYFDPEVTL
jgi:hypothetical protein